jgi:hypothetical protein
VANMIAPSEPTSASNNTVPTHRVIANSPTADNAVGSRAANSVSPKRRTDAPCSQ